MPVKGGMAQDSSLRLLLYVTGKLLRRHEIILDGDSGQTQERLWRRHFCCAVQMVTYRIGFVPYLGAV